jgi:hypothetical protein
MACWFHLIKRAPATLKYEPGLILADGEYVIVHGRFSGHGRPRSWIAADIVRMANGVLAQQQIAPAGAAEPAADTEGRHCVSEARHPWSYQQVVDDPAATEPAAQAVHGGERSLCRLGDVGGF